METDLFDLKNCYLYNGLLNRVRWVKIWSFLQFNGLYFGRETTF